MFQRFILAAFFLSFSASSFANCKSVWELKTLATTQETQNLLSEYNYQYVLPADFLCGLESLHQKIDRVSGIDTRLLLCNSDEANLFAWKEGEQHIIAMTLGLTSRLGNDFDVYAAALAHQNAHLAKNHTGKISASNVGYGALSAVTGVVGVVAAKGQGGLPLTSYLSDLSTEAFSKVYSPAQEAEADQTGLQYLMQAGFATNGALRLHDLLHRNSPFHNTHPATENRTAELKGIMQQMGIDVSKLDTTSPSPNMLVPLKDNNSSLAKVVTAKSKLGYYIATLTGQEEVSRGMRVAIRYENGEKLVGTVREVLEGYFSVTADKPFAKNIEGATISKINEAH